MNKQVHLPMLPRKRCLLLFICFLSISTLIWAEPSSIKDISVERDVLSISGTVTDLNSGEALIGVSILVKGTGTGTITDIEGNYQIEVDEGQTLVFTYTGYAAQEIIVGQNPIIDVALSASVAELNEVVVVGYGVQRKRDVTGAIVSVDEEQLAQRTPVNVFEAIQGQMAGIQINTGSGAPGENGVIRIRGASTFNAGTSPLFILDGQPVDNIDNINPNDIKSIEVLKDGASAAIYGSRSANGVIIVTTKSGQSGKTSITANYVRSYNTLRKMPVANAQERLLYDLLRGTQKNTLVDTLNQMWQINNDFQDIFYRNAIRDQVNVSISSGSDKTKFYWNSAFLNQQGVLPSQKFQRYNTRVNIDHEFNDRIRMGIRLQASYGETFNVDPQSEANWYGATIIKAAYSPYINPDGTFLTNITSFRGRNNLLDVMDRLEDRRRSINGSIFQYLEFDLIDNLKYRANFGVDGEIIRNSLFAPEAIGGQNENIDASFFTAFDYNWIHESILTYDKELGDHRITALAGFSAQRWSRPEEQIQAMLANNLIPTLNNVAGAFDAAETFTVDQEDSALASVFGRITYNYNNKYSINASLRRDGSSRFGPGNRWGSFPAVSVFWRASEEPFLQGLTLFDDIKLRASYAITGNERINNRDFDALLSIGNFYQGLNGVGLSNQLANPAIAWEETQQTNFGVDLGVLGNRITISLDYYIKQTTELLANLPLPAQTGFNQARINLGEIENKGFEVSFQATVLNLKDFRWNTNFNFSTNTNQITDIAGGVPIITRNHITEIGQSLGNFFGYQIAGIFPYDESNAFTPDGQQLTPNFDGSGNFTNYTLNGSTYSGEVNQITVGGTTSGGGDYHYIDQDNNFSIDGDDRVVLGNAYPRYFGGWRNDLTYKGFSFSFLFDYQFDVEIFNNFHQTMSNFTLNSWTPIPFIILNTYEGPGDETALFPNGRRSQNLLGTGAPTSYWIEEADFIKLRNIKLSYNFSNRIMEKIGLAGLTIFGSINNALVWTNYTGFDPEVNSVNNNGIGNNALTPGVDNARYPRGREFIFGANINF